MATSPISAQYMIRRRRSIEDHCKLRRVFYLTFYCETQAKRFKVHVKALFYFNDSQLSHSDHLLKATTLKITKGGGLPEN